MYILYIFIDKENRDVLTLFCSGSTAHVHRTVKKKNNNEKNNGIKIIPLPRLGIEKQIFSGERQSFDVQYFYVNNQNRRHNFDDLPRSDNYLYLCILSIVDF